MTAPYKTNKVVIMVFNSWVTERYYRGVKMTYLGCSGTLLNAQTEYFKSVFMLKDSKTSSDKQKWNAIHFNRISKVNRFKNV